MPKTKSQETKHIFILLRIGVVAAGLTWAAIWLSKEQRWSDFSAVFFRMNLGVFAVTLSFFALAQLMIGFRWWLLLRTQSVFISLWPAVRLHFLGLFYNNFMPGVVGGDLLRAWYVTKHTDRRFEAALSVFVDRLIGLSGSLAIAMFCYCFFLLGQGRQAIFTLGGSPLTSLAKYKVFLLVATLVVAVLLCSLMLHKQGRVFLKRGWLYIRIRGRSVVEKSKNALVLYRSKPMAILTIFGLTVFLQILTITGFWFLGVNLGVNAAAKYYYVFFPLSWAFGALPVSVGGAVVVEGLLAYLFIYFAGIEAEAALALALCQRIVWMIASLPGAAIHIAGAHLPKDFSIDCK